MWKRWLVVALALGGCAGGDYEQVGCARTPVGYRFAGTTPGAENRFKRDFCLSLIRVRRWWGPTHPGPFAVDVQEAAGPSMALVPAWRGQRGTMRFPFRPVERGSAAIVHELVHVFGPNANRFLAEGLAVHAQMALKGNAAYPNFGQDLHLAARPLAVRAKLTELDRIATPARLEHPGTLDGRDSYIVAGSFVRFLIESRGMAPFRRLYDLTPLVPGQRDAGAADRWADVYGEPLEALAEEWRKAIR